MTPLLLSVAILQATAFDPADYLIVRKGDFPVVLSAPHGGRKMAPGVPERVGGPNVQRFVNTLDGLTQETTFLLEQEIIRTFGRRPYVVVADFSRKQVDANRDQANGTESEGGVAMHRAYHGALRQAADEIRRGWGAGLLLDIHAQGPAPDALIRGTRQLRSVTDLLRRRGRVSVLGPNSFLGTLHRLGWKIEPENDAADQFERRFDGGYITDSMGSHQTGGIDAIQLELGIQFRNAEGRPKFTRDAATALKTFIHHFEPNWLQSAR